MKKILFLFLSINITTFFACKDDEVTTTDYEYHAHIEAPDNTEKKIGDELDIHINFESHAGLPVHHINITIKNKATGDVVYNKPTEAHVHDTSGEYLYEDHFHLEAANGVVAGTYVLTAKVWGEKDGEGEESESIEFVVK